MMTHKLKYLAGSAVLALAAGSAHGATLGLTPQTPILETSGATIDYLELGSTGELSSFGAAIDFTDGVSADEAELSFAFGVPLDGASEAASGGFDITSANDLLLEGTLSEVGYVEDVIEVAFGDLDGALADDFGSTALLSVYFDDQLGANPFNGLVDGASYVAAVTVTAVSSPDAPMIDDMDDLTPIPLPASGLLLLFGGGMAGAIMRRRQRTN